MMHNTSQNKTLFVIMQCYGIAMYKGVILYNKVNIFNYVIYSTVIRPWLIIAHVQLLLVSGN